jgi:hypothetical protein
MHGGKGNRQLSARPIAYTCSLDGRLLLFCKLLSPGKSLAYQCGAFSIPFAFISSFSAHLNVIKNT